MKKLILLLLFLMPTITKADNNGLVGYWKFDEGSQGIVHDFSGNRNDATATNTISWTSGRINKAITLNGMSVLTAGKPSALTGTALGRNVTFSAWVYPTSFTDHSYHAVIARAFTSNYWFGLYTTTGRIQTWVGGVATFSTGAIELNKWSHIASTWDGANVRFYINGVLDSTVANTNAPVGSAVPNLNIGADYSAGTSGPYNYWFTGKIDEVKIYNRTFTAKQILNEYQAGSTIISNNEIKGLIGHWKFDEGTSTTAGDYSGRRNIGTLTNGPLWVSGKLGNGISFDSSNDAVVIPGGGANYRFDDADGATVAFWYYATDTNTGRYLMSTAEDSTKGWSIYTRSGPSLEFVLGKSSVIYRVQIPNASYPTVVGKWNHFAYKMDVGGSPVFYVNGVNVSSQVNDGGSGTVGESTASFTIGNYPTFSSGANAILDDVRFYNRSLSATEIKKIYNYGQTTIQEFGKNTGLLAYYPLDEATSTTFAKDYSGNANNLQLIATPTWVSGRVGSALNFNGTSQYSLSTRKLGISGNASITMCAWIYMDRTTVPTGYESFMGNNSTGVTAQGLSMTMLAARPAIDFWSTRWRATTPLSLKTWHHVCGTKTPGLVSATSKIYVNGALVAGATETDSTPNITDSGAVVGRLSNNGTYWFTGKVDEARFYNRALSASEILTLYKSGSTFIK